MSERNTQEDWNSFAWSEEKKPFKENEEGLDTKKIKLIKTELRCISHGLVGPIYE